MTGVPSGWHFDADAGGGLAVQLLIPAAGALISHVLTSISAGIFNFAGGAAVNSQLQVFDGATLITDTYFLFINGVGADSNTWDTTYIGTPGQTMSVNFSLIAPVNTVEFLHITGYDL